MKLRIATRQSQLALTQTRWVAEQLRRGCPDLVVEEIAVTTRADQILDRPLAALGGKGLFVSEVERLVVDGVADIAVHSLKDVPGDVELPEGLGLICLPPREDARDVLVTLDGRELDDLARGARVGTTSLRREAQLRARRPDLVVETLRGNVGTRLGKLQEGRFDAIVLAAAGLSRLGLLEGLKHQILPTEVSLPAVGQGTLAIEGRVDDETLRALLAPLDDAETRLCTEAERGFLRRLLGSCRVPVAGHARLADGARLSLEGLVGSIDGEILLTGAEERYLEGRTPEARHAEARALGEALADGLRARGADDLMRQAEAAVIEREKRSNGHGSGGDRFKWSR